MITSKVTRVLIYYWHDFWQINGSQHTSSLTFFNSGPWVVLFILGCYLLFIKVYGPKIMKHREPFKLKKLLLLYNIVLVYLSAYVFVKGSLISRFGLDAWNCRKEIYDLNIFPFTQKYIHLTWIYYFSKLIELADTVFFVFRKKQRQINNLHIIHHTTVPISVWIGLKFSPNLLYSFFPWINAGIHSLMYTYYGLTALAPSLNINRWKKYLTLAQIGQFILAIVHSAYLIINPNCPFPISAAINTFANALLFLSLFLAYYRSSYKAIKGKINGPLDLIKNNNNQETKDGTSKLIKSN